MRKKIVAGNWKMNLSLEEALSLQDEINKTYSNENCEVILFSPSIYLTELKKNETKITIGAQNAFPKDSGAFTGEISIAQLKNIGIHHLLIGHSERRSLFHEENELLKEKVTVALEKGFQIIFCVGEELEDREKGTYKDLILNQLKDSLFHISTDDLKNVVIAYEPVWAIGTGKTASSDQANEVHAFIREAIEEKYGKLSAAETRILYGGSCKPENAEELFEQPNIDGGLIGGASLKANDFLSIINAAK